jgi:hypothetical protein
MAHMAVARLNGGYKVTPFFDESGEPVVLPGDGPAAGRA